MLQWYVNVPATVKVNENELPFPSTGESHTAVSDVEVWPKPSRFVQVTVSPTWTVVVGGLNADPWIVTALVAANATIGSASSPQAAMRLATQTTAARLTAIPYA